VSRLDFAVAPYGNPGRRRDLDLISYVLSFFRGSVNGVIPVFGKNGISLAVSKSSEDYGSLS